MAEKTLLEIKNLTVGFGAGKHISHVVNGLDLTIERGRCMGLVGESGSGKSMIALAIMQLLPYAAWVNKESQILLHEKNILNYSEQAMRHIRGSRMGMIFQDAMSAFNPVFTIGHQMQEIVRRHLHFSIRKAKQHAFDLLKEVGIDDLRRTYHAYPHQLSGGMRQRAMIAMALCGEPEFIIADEPTTALDVTIQAQILQLLKDLKSQHNISLLFISHDLAVVSRLADHIAVLKQGQCVEQATSHVFFKNPSHEYSRKLLAAIPSIRPRHEMAKVEKKLLRVDHLKVYFPIRGGFLKRKIGDVKAVDDISFNLSQGQTMALVGESGSGKTTTAKAIVQLIKSSAGDIIFNHKNLAKQSNRAIKKQRDDFQIIFQDPYAALNPRMMIADSISEGLLAQRISRSREQRLARVDELLQRVGLSPEHKWRYPHEFSGGERQRICIARALALKPKLLILDEPTSALDVFIQMQMLQLLEDLQDQYGLAYLLITHNVSIVAYMSHYLAVMYRGKIVEQGATEVLLQDPQHEYTKKLLASVPKIKD